MVWKNKPKTKCTRRRRRLFFYFIIYRHLGSSGCVVLWNVLFMDKTKTNAPSQMSPIGIHTLLYIYYIQTQKRCNAHTRIYAYERGAHLCAKTVDLKVCAADAGWEETRRQLRFEIFVFILEIFAVFVARAHKKLCRAMVIWKFLSGRDRYARRFAVNSFPRKAYNNAYL